MTKIRIIRQPQGNIDGIGLDRFRPGEIYDVTTNLAHFLVAEGFAIFE